MPKLTPPAAQSTSADLPAPWRRLASIVPRPVWRIALYAGLTIYFAFGIAVLVLRYAILPNIDSYRGDLERLVGASLGLKVSVRAIDADWQGLRPRLSLHGVRIFDQAGRPALGFEQVRAVVAWASLPLLSPRLEWLEIEAPVLAMRRDPDGSVYVAGIRVGSAGDSSDMSAWLLSQRRIVVRNASVQWLDLQRGAPLLELQRVNLRLENFLSHHRFGLTAEPPQALAARLDVRGDFRGRSRDALAKWKGEAYADLGFADLAAWQPWLDYPLELPQGHGALRLWLEVGDKKITGATADVAFKDVKLRLDAALPMLDLSALTGRLTAKWPGKGFEAGGRQLSLATRDGITVAPTDFAVRYSPVQGRTTAAGNIAADGLDLGALARLSEYLPLDEATRRRLAQYAPSGKVFGLKAHWSGSGEAPLSYGIDARFENLGISPHARLPGFSALSGAVSADERGGRVALGGRKAALLLPAVFAEARLDLDRLALQGSWTKSGALVDFHLENLEFENRDAAGTAAGRYQTMAEGPGRIDLTARLARADAAAVWRYMPLVVGANVRDWLQRSIGGGRAADARLQLRGELRHFPFVDAKQGIFQVTGRFSGATLRYAPDWPEITGIDGELLFHGKRMLITASKGAVYRTALAGVSAEIADLATHDPLLVVKGSASGPTAEFLRFIATSPVSEWIGHFTDAASAGGNGKLQLALNLPLARMAKAQVKGEFDFADNRIAFDPGLPPLTAANAHVVFSERGITIRNATARVLGSPASIAAETRDGIVRVSMQGKLAVADLRREFDVPLLDHLSGAAAWRGSVDVRPRQVALRIESDLRGVASSLPEPFNKSALTTLPLRVERSALPDAGGSAASPRDQVQITLGDIANATLARRSEGGKTIVERGMVGINRTPETAPQRGVLAGATLRFLDLDAWRRLAGGAQGVPSLPLSALNLRADELVVFGQRLKNFEMKAARESGVWQAQVASRELSGELEWQDQGKGRLRARLAHLEVAEITPGAAAESRDGETATKELPGLDVAAEAFSLRGKALGRLELRADNRGNTWRIGRLAIQNPDGTLEADGQWRAGKASGATQLNFRLDASDSGKLLERLGYANAVKRGSAKLAGKVAWSGTPARIDYPSLEGNMTLEASRGQFAKLEPGVGRLLGIVSLQSLPRRISLDFRDVFSEGFAFDSINGSMSIKHGTMRTEDLFIRGPAARIKMAGSVNLIDETQNLRVGVQPTLSESVAIGAAVVNPLVGLAAYVAQKALRDPIEKMFAYEYDVTGPWADPKVEKVVRAAPAAPAATVAPPP